MNREERRRRRERWRIFVKGLKRHKVLFKILSTSLDIVKRLTTHKVMISNKYFFPKLAYRHRMLYKIEDISLILISQVQRSGGSLLSQLLDGHPECLSYPFELLWGKPDKYYWPVVEGFSDPAQIFNHLRSTDMAYINMFQTEGYSKFCNVVKEDSYPFLYNYHLHKKIFTEEFKCKRPSTSREILNLFLISLFQAWLDYQNFYGKKKRFVTAFTPQVNIYSRNSSNIRFFSDYPDGYLISIIRDPRNWYASALRQRPRRYRDIERSMSLWRESTTSTLKLYKKFPKNVIPILFDDLILKTRAVMEYICERTTLKWDSLLLSPTFNYLPIKSNSSFNPQTGVSVDTVKRFENLSGEDRSFIEKRYLGTYQEASEMLKRDLTAFNIKRDREVKAYNG